MRILDVCNENSVDPHVSVVIVAKTFPNANLDKMLGSIKNLTAKHEVLVIVCNIGRYVDVESHLSMLIDKDKNLTRSRLLVTSTDKGLSFGRNLGTTLSTSSNLLFADDDSFVLEDITQAIQLLEKGVCQGVQPLILSLENNQIVDSAGDFVREATPFFYNAYPRDAGKSVKAVGGYLFSEEIPSMRGAFMLIQKKALQSVGGFDNNFGFMFDDVDIGWRMVSAGYKLLFMPNVRALHKGGKTVHPSDPYGRAYWRGLLNYYSANLKIRSPLYWPFIVAHFFTKYFLFGFLVVRGKRTRLFYAPQDFALMVVLFARTFKAVIAHWRVLAGVFHFQGREKLAEFARGKRIIFEQ